MTSGGSSKRWAVALLFGSLTTLVPAQVDVTSHREWSWLQLRRRALLEIVKDQSLQREAEVAEMLTRDRESVPLLTLARGFAAATGIEPDAGYFFRAGLQVFAMPEVVAKPRPMAITIYAPHTGLTGKLPMPRKFQFAVRILNAKGKVVKAGDIEETTEIRDLREYRAVTKLSVSDLPAGEYRVEVDTILDGERPRATDLPLFTHFAILDDYAGRAGFFRIVPVREGEKEQELVTVLKKLEPLPRAILHGAAEYACRAWHGLPGVDPRHAVPDLLRAEKILANVKAKRFPLDGVSGLVTIALPGPAKDVEFVALRLPEDGLPPVGSDAWKRLARRPLMLLMSAAPSLDRHDKRPSAPRYALPGYLAESLRVVGFDAERRFQLAVVESPGRMRNTRAGLLALMKHLPEVFPFDADRIVLVGDGHGARGIVDLALEMPTHVRGLVVVNTGAGLATPQLRKLRDTPILGIPGHKRSGADSVGRLREYAKYAEKKTGLQILDQRPWPWCLAVPLAARHIELFGREVTR